MKFIALLLFLLMVMPLKNTNCDNISKISKNFVIKFKNFNSFSKKNFNIKFNSNISVLPELNLVFVNNLTDIIYNILDIEYIEPNYKYKIFKSNTVYETPQWNMTKIQAQKAWDIEKGSKSVVVAVIDTGVDYTHEDLKNNIWVNTKEIPGNGIDDDNNGFIDDVYGYDFVNKKGNGMDDHSHGTHCAGVIGAEHNNIGVEGVNWNVSIMPVKFLSKTGEGTLEDAILAIKYAVDNGANILSNSWGGGGFSQALLDVIVYAKDRGVLFVAAAGNEYTSTPSYPAAYQSDNIISVAASDSNDQKASFSNWGIPWVHIAAPGVDVYSSVVGNKYAAYSGTSMACPHVAGASALLLAHENLDYKAIKNRIFNTSDYLSQWEEKVTTAGRLNLYNMIANIIPPERPIPPDDTKWVKVDFTKSSEHPYLDNTDFYFNVPLEVGTKYIRVHFSSFDTESGYDKVFINGKNKVLTYDGNKGAFVTNFLDVTGMSVVVVQFKSDYSVRKMGWDIDYIEVQ